MISAAPYTIHHSPQGSPRGLFSCPLSNTPQHRTQTHAAQPLASYAMPEGYF